MNIAIVDDMSIERKVLMKILQDYADQNHIEITLMPFSCAEELLADYHPLQYTILFLDIYMDGMTGVEAAEKIRLSDPDTYIYHDFSLDGMELPPEPEPKPGPQENV